MRSCGIVGRALGIAVSLMAAVASAEGHALVHAATLSSTLALITWNVPSPSNWLSLSLNSHSGSPLSLPPESPSHLILSGAFDDAHSAADAAFTLCEQGGHRSDASPSSSGPPCAHATLPAPSSAVAMDGSAQSPWDLSGARLSPSVRVSPADPSAHRVSWSAAPVSASPAAPPLLYSLFAEWTAPTVEASELSATDPARQAIIQPTLRRHAIRMCSTQSHSHDQRTELHCDIDQHRLPAGVELTMHLITECDYQRIDAEARASLPHCLTEVSPELRVTLDPLLPEVSLVAPSPISFTTAPGVAQVANDTAVRQALCDFYNQTSTLPSGDCGALVGWCKHDGWCDPMISVCSWYGIQCDTSRQFVTSLLLPRNGLSLASPTDLSALFQSIPQLQQLDWSNNPALHLSRLDLTVLSNLTVLKVNNLISPNLASSIPLLFPQSCNLITVVASSSSFDLSAIVQCPRLASLSVGAIITPFPFALIASLPALVRFDAAHALLSTGPAGVYAGLSGVVTNMVLSNLNSTNPALQHLILSSAAMSFSEPNVVDNWPHVVSPTLVELVFSGISTLRTGPNGPGDAWLADLPSLRDLGLANLHTVRLTTAAFAAASAFLNIVYLTSTPLSGSLDSMCHLHQLTTLWMDDCSLRSALPTNISACWPLLNQLNAAGCALFGPLPDFRHLPQLGVLDLSGGNSLSGPIGADFVAESSTLGILNLAANQLTAPGPSLCGVGLFGLRLDLSANRIGALPDLSCYGTVNSLLLSGNPMDSTVPSNFWSLVSPSIQTIDLSYSLLHGSFPSRPSNQSDYMLQSFSISNSRLSGPLPRNIHAPSLDFSMANFSGPVILFDDATNPESVVTLNLESAGALSCPIMLGNLTALKTLSLANASFAGCDWTDPAVVQLPPSITVIDISNCDWAPMVLPVGASWLTLHADHANIIGLEMPPGFTGALTSISLNGNSLPGFATGSLIGGFSTLANLELSPFTQFISCISCQITAPLRDVLPNSLFATTMGLRVLRLGNNSISGLFYDGLKQSDSLALPVTIEEFSLANNPIQGRLPTVSPDFAAFRTFDVSGTGMTGPFPASWGELSSMLQIEIGGTTMACTLLVDSAGQLQCADQIVLTGSPSTQEEAVSLADPAATVHCSALVIVATGSTNVEADPSYHAHTLCHCDDGGFGLHARCYRCPEGCTCSQDTIQNCFPVVQRGSITVNPALDSSGNRIVVDESIAPFSISAVLPCPRTVTGGSLCNPDGIAWPSFYRIMQTAEAGSVSASLSDSGPSSPSDSELDLSSWCYPGHTGRLCAACSSGYFSSGRWCLRCLSSGVHVLILIANLLLIVALIAYLYVKSPGAATAAKGLQLYLGRLSDSTIRGTVSYPMRSTQSDNAAATESMPPTFAPADAVDETAAEAANPLKLLIFHSQQLSLLLHTSTSLPPVMTGLLSAMSSGSNGLSLSSLIAMDCLSNWTLRERCWMAVVAPTIIGLVAGATTIIDRQRGLDPRASRSMRLQGRDEPLLPVESESRSSPSSALPRVYSVCVSLLYFLFFPCAQTVLSAVTCTDTRESAQSYLNLYPTVACDAEWHRSVLPPAVLGLLFWVVAFPLGSTLTLLRLRAKIAAADASESSASSSSSLSVWPICSDLLSPYSPRFWHWEQLLLLRRLMLVAAVTIIPASSLYLPLCLFAIIQLSALQQHWAQPYAHSLLNAGELASLYLLLINYISAIILQTGLTEGGFQQTANGWAAALFSVNFAFLLILVAGLFGWARQRIEGRLRSQKHQRL